jgi:4-hydroxyproline epimerase
MCGHGMIGYIVTLAYLGKIQPGIHKVETPVGIVEAELNEDFSVTVRNVPSYRYQAAVRVEVPGEGVVTGDIAWGGNWFFLINEHGQDLSLKNTERLTEYAWKVRQALEAQGITGENGGLIDHIELFGQPQSAENHSKSFVLCPGKAYDRSPAAPAPAPNWPVWPLMANCRKTVSGIRKAYSAAYSMLRIALPMLKNTKFCQRCAAQPS